LEVAGCAWPTVERRRVAVAHVAAMLRREWGSGTWLGSFMGMSGKWWWVQFGEMRAVGEVSTVS